MKPTQPIKVLVVDDSAFMRKALSMMLESDPGIKVVGTANNGEDGLNKVKLLKPDLVTMDVEMPRMDGLTALRHIMNNNPLPVMMVSSITTDGAKATMEALELGAVDFIPKQMSYVSLDIVRIKDDLLAKIKNIVSRKSLLMAKYRTRQASRACRTSQAQAPSQPPPSVPKRHRTMPVQVVTIGSSTGGPPALQAVISGLPRNLPVGIVIAQHMPPMFTKSLAERLDQTSQLTVREAEDGDSVEPGLVLVAPGGKQMTVKRFGGRSRIIISDEPAEALYKPCVDVLFNSVAGTYRGGTMGVMLTGMGSNGVEGTRLLKSVGGVMIAQNEDSCVVYGMPRAVIEAKLADHVAPIESIASEISSYF